MARSNTNSAITIEPIGPVNLVEQAELAFLAEERRGNRDDRHREGGHEPQHQRIDPAMPRLVSQRGALEALSLRFGRMSSIAVMRRNTPAKAARRISPSLWPRRPSIERD